nr:pentapeptide repeat-containing protein [candidate division KSB1 bacterium]NIS28302.1 pentapeptide repeat-containing protein [candidate division KSB1 bacterium]NIU27417.1 pentapeptide repeat-containing protein [candidate division KSB1 bacterium]NIU90588.1 pentapeptide repeat-containing protein [candidate division KSB1 bacterium]NIV93744.1 pentapeptide repeat-containing protein [candidate division KSB1 bacterium]
ANLTRAFLTGANLDRADLTEANMYKANLTETNLYRADLIRANLIRADLASANLTEANLISANLDWAHLTEANLTSANLDWADLFKAVLSGTNLRNASLIKASLIMTNLEMSDLSGCSIYGISVWDLNIESAIQSNLVISKPGEPIITVDNLEVAQFIYLLLNNERIRHVIDTITSKVVLILGSFAETRKQILDAIRGELRKRDYLPILFDFTKLSSRDTVETISTLAHMARFVIADLTNAKSILQELQRIVPSLPSLPVKPLLLESDYEPGMIDHFKNYKTFLAIHRYTDNDSLIASLGKKVIEPAEAKRQELNTKI